LNIPLWSFIIIGIGSLSCILAGYLAEKFGAQKIAFNALLLSGICCLIAPFMFSFNSEIVFIAFLLSWGIFVIADSPLFSTLVAKNAPVKNKGTALTIAKSIVFAITSLSIQTISYLLEIFNSNYIFMVLAIGPIIGLFSFSKQKIIK
jgi:predicted MFS family arabinose efflux permease